MDVQERRRLRVDGLLQAFLRRALRGEIAEAARRDVVLGEGVCQFLADLGGFGELGGRGRGVGVLEGDKEALVVMKRMREGRLEDERAEGLREFVRLVGLRFGEGKQDEEMVDVGG